MSEKPILFAKLVIYFWEQFISIHLNIFPPTSSLKIIATLSITTIRCTTWPTVFTQFFFFQTRMIESGLRFDYSLLVPQPQIVPSHFTGWFSKNFTKMNKKYRVILPIMTLFNPKKRPNWILYPKFGISATWIWHFQKITLYSCWKGSTIKTVSLETPAA